MDRPRNLAEYLGISDPRHPEVVPGPPIADLTNPKKFCQAILQSPEFRTYLLNGIILGNLPPQIVMRIMDTGWGKLVDRVEVNTTSENASVEQLEQRALMLVEMAKRIRAAKNDSSGSVH